MQPLRVEARWGRFREVDRLFSGLSQLLGDWVSQVLARLGGRHTVYYEKSVAPWHILAYACDSWSKDCLEQ